LFFNFFCTTGSRACNSYSCSSRLNKEYKIIRNKNKKRKTQRDCAKTKQSSKIRNKKI